MRRLPAIAAIGATVLALGATAAPGRTGVAQAGAPQSFAFAIGNGQLRGGPADVADRFGAFDLVVVDGELASAEEVAAVRAAGAVVLAYLSVGTIERWRSWYPRLKRYRLAAWRDWQGEWFADVSRRGLRTELADRIAPELLAKGFDGLFLDNVDMIEARRHRAQRPGMAALVHHLGELAHADGRVLHTQNGAWGLRKLGVVDQLDGWNREDVTSTYDFDRHAYERTRRGARRAALRELRRMAALGLTTTATDYAAGGDRATRRRAVRNACRAGALPYVSDIALTVRRLPEPPLRCR